MGKGSKKKTVWRQFSFGDFDNDSYSKGDEEDSESSKGNFPHILIYSTKTETKTETKKICFQFAP